MARVFGALTVVGALALPVALQADPVSGPGLFSTTNTGDLSSTVPSGTCHVRVSATGGGGGSPSNPGTGGRGGAGATVNATFDVLPLQPWAASVGGGGTSGGTGGVNGGGSTTAVTGHAGGGGGGRTIVTLGGQQVVIAAGGGGGGGAHQSSPLGNGGNAGTLAAAGVGVGANGNNGQDSPGNITVGGGRGGQTAAGGAGGVNSSNGVLNGQAGGGVGSGTGGSAADPDWDGGGGGGAGYTGGGGGASTANVNVTGGGGGGGSSYVQSTSPTVTATPPSAISSTVGSSAVAGANGTNGQVSLDWVPCLYDLVTTKTVTPNPVVAGQTATWTITVTNNGPDPMTRGDILTLGDTLPGPGTQLVSVTTSGGSNPNLTRGPITCSGLTVGSPLPASTDCSRAYSAVAGTPGTPSGGLRGLDPGESISIVYTQPLPTSTSAGTLTNTATVKDRPSMTGTTDLVGTIVTDSAVRALTVQSNADLRITKTASAPTIGTNGSLTYTLLIENLGVSDAPDVTVTDPLPSGSTFSSASAGCTNSSGTVTCAVGALAAGASTTRTITIAAPATTGTMTNTATVSSSSTDLDSSNNTSSVNTAVVATADLGVTKTVNTSAPAMNGNVTFTVTATNSGPQSATGVVVNDALPAGLTFVSATPSVGTYNSSTGVWTIGTLANAGSATLTITATATVITSVTNTATISSPNVTDSNATNDTASAAVNATDADLDVTKTVSDSSPNVNGNVTYTISVHNNGADTATGVTVTDLLPSGLTYVSDNGSGTYVSSTGVWSAGSLTNGQTKTLQITAQVTTANPVTNTATITGSSQYDPVSSNNTSSVAVDARAADLAITKTVDNAAPDVNGNVTYTVTVANNGPDGATGVVVNDLLPSGATYVSDNGSGAYVSSTGVWTVGSMANGASVSLQITAKITTQTVVTNTATVTSTSTDTGSGNNTASVGVNAKDANLAITKTVSNASPDLNGNVTYTLTVTNNGPDTAASVTVNDLLPSGLTYVSDNGSGAYVSSTGVWTIGSMINGATASLQITAKVTTTSPVTNTATVASATTYDPTSANNTASVAVDARAADLAITKTVDNATPDVNGNVTYTVTVTNNGPDAATGVVVNDLLPSGATYVSDNGSGAYVSSTGVWTVGSIANGGSASLQITAKITTPSAVTNTATVTSTSTDTVPGNNTASVGVNAKDADLAVTKSVNNASANVGQNVIFTVTVANNGPDTASGVTVGDLLPSGLTYVSDDASGAYVSSTGVWTVGTLTSGTSATVHITARVDVNTAVTNTASITGSSVYDPTSTNNSASATVDAPEADVRITKTVSDSTPELGQTVTYTLVVSNAGPWSATNVVAHDLLPSGVTFLSASPAPSGTDVLGQYWNLGTMASGASQTITVSARVDSLSAQTNSAVVSADQFDTNTANNTAQATTSAKQANLAVTKTVDDATPQVNGSVGYTVTVTNNGPDSASAVVVNDLLPSGLTYVSDDGSGAYVSSTGVWTIGTLANGATRTLHITAQVTSPSAVTNTATVSSGTYDPTAGNNTASVVVNAKDADLDVTKTVDDASPNLNGDVTYTIAVHNNGPDTATGVAVTDLLPTGLTYVSDNGSGAYVSSTGVWTVGSLLNGQTKTLTITATVTTASAVTNTAAITASGVFDPTSSNNTSSVAVDARAADVALTKTVNTATPDVNGNVTYTLTVINNGPDAATGVAVNDLLPSGATYVSDNGSGAYVSSTGVWTIGALANGASTSLQITAKITSPTTVTNTATATSTSTDTDATNSSASVDVNAKDADLVVTKTVDDSTPDLNGNVTYTVSVHNNGPDDTTGVAVTDLLPSGLTYVSDTGSGAYVSSTGVWTVGSLTSGQTKTLKITATVATASAVTNTATVSASALFDATSSNDSDAVVVDARTANLAMTKTVDDATPDVNGNVVFTLTVINNGPDAATGVTVTDLLPSGATYVSDNGAGAYVSSTGVWAIGSLANGASTSLQITATITTKDAISNTAAVSSTSTDTVSGNNSASVGVNATDADLTITKTVDDSTPDLNGNVTYTVSVTNDGPDDTTGVSVTDLLPSGLTYVSDTASGAYVSSTGVWTVGSLTSGQTKTLKITATVTTLSAVTNAAAITGSSVFDPTSSNNTDSVAVDARAADLAMTKTVDDATPDVNGNVIFTLTVTNNGPDAATGVVVDDVLPAGLTYVSDDGAGSYNDATGTWTVGGLANGATATLHLTATVDADGTITNTATASATSFDTDTTDNTASVDVNANTADLELIKSVDTTSPDLGDTVTFTLTITNNGADASVDTTVDDALPAGLTYVSDDGAGAYDSATGVWSVGTLANGASKTLHLTATAATVDSVTNTATATATTYDPATGDNTATATVDARASDVGITKVADVAKPSVGETITYTITVTSFGPDDATGIVAHDLIPPGMTYMSDDGAGAYDPLTGDWVIGSLANGDSAVLHISVTLDTTADVVNTASVISSTTDPDGSNDSSSVTTPTRLADLAMDKTVSDATPNVGDLVTYTLTVTNLGPDDATATTVTDKLPAGLTYVSDDGAGAYNATTGVWSAGTLTLNQSATLTITARVDGHTTITNTATAKTTSVDTVSTNNADSASLNAKDANLVVTKTVDDSTPDLNGNVTYTVSVHNNGPDDTTGVAVTDLLPSGLTYVSDNAAGDYVSSTGVWTVGGLTSGQTKTLTITATVTTASPVTNTATIAASSLFDPTSSNNTSSIAVDARTADLSMIKTVNTATPDVNGNVTYTVTVTNNGPDGATGVVVTDLLPDGATYVSDNGSGAYVSSTGVWTVGAIANGASRSLTITAKITTHTAITNTADVTSTSTDTVPGNDTASVDVNAKDADLALTKTVSDATPPLGSQVTYTLTLTNNGPDAAASAKVTDLLPNGLTYVSDNGSGSYVPATGLWTVGPIASGDAATLEIVATVTTTNTVTNGAAITATGTHDPNTTNDSASASISSVAADLKVTKIVNDASPNLNDTVTFDVTVTNNGPNDATGVKVSDLLPTGLTYVSDTGSGAYVSSTGVWTIGALASGTDTTLTIDAKVTTTDPVTNTATVSSTTVDPATADNTATATVDARSADLSMTKSVSNTTPTVGDDITYTVTVHNGGPDSAADVTVTDILPTGVTYVSDNSAGAYDTATGVWTVGSLASGADAVLTITATVTTAGPITNSATASTTSTDPTASNDTASATLTATSADLDVTKTVDDSTPDLDGTITYTLTLHNNGPDAATGVVVTDQLPSGLTYVSDSGAGAYDDATGVWTVGTIANGATTTLTITAKVTSLSAITNTATITASSVHDPDTTNDVSSVSVDAMASDLSVSKTANVSTATVGDTVTYTVVATNNGPDTATAVSVSDQLPAGITWVSDNGTGAYDHTTGTWTIGSLVGAASRTLMITATITGTGSIANTATITAPGTDPDSTNDSSTATVTVPSADLAITKSVSSATPNVGDTITYTVVVTNNGPDGTSGVTVTDQLPAGLTYVSDNASGAYDAGTGVWNVGSLADGATATLTIDATVDVNTPVTNTAAITAADDYDPMNTNDSASVSVDAPQSDLEVTKTVSDPTPNLGTSVTYTLTVTNNGTSPATGVVLHDLAPAGIDVTSTSVPSDGTDVLGDYWNIGSLAVGASRTVTITATITSNATLTNTAVVSGDQYDTDTSDNTAQATTSATSADLIMSKTVSDTTPNLGSTVTYTLTVDNAGPGIADGVVVTDQLPAGLTYVSSSGTGTYTASTGVWDIGTIANDASATRTIIARVTTLAAVTNTAAITESSLGDPAPANNTSSVTVNAIAADLEMTKSVSNATPTVGDTVTFTLTVANNGPDASTGIVVADTLPAGLTYVSDTGAGAYDDATGDWTVGSLANGASASIDITATVTSDASIVNTATAGSDVVDPTPANNADSATVDATQSDLALTKTVDVQTPDRVGDAVTFTLTVTNNGPDSASAIQVTDQLPAGLTYVSDSGAGAYDAGTGVWTVGTLASGADATLTITATIDSVDAVTNTAAITGSDQFDPTSSNDTDTATVNVPQADLSITKTVDDATPTRIGDAVTFTLTVANAGPDASSADTTVNDLLPTGLTYVSDDAAGAYDATTGVWQVASVPNGATRTLRIIATVDSPATLTNSATVTSPNDDPNTANDSDSVSVTAESANVAVTKSVNFLTPNQGSDVIYSIMVVNNGPDTATGVTVQDQLPAGVTYVSDNGSGSYDSASGVWTVGSLADTASKTLQITATVGTADPVTNTATVDADQRDTDTTDNSAEALIDPVAADVAITKTVDDAKPAVGDTVTYTITATNNGPDLATGVVVNDMFPAGITVLTATPSATGANALGSFWNVGSLTSGQSRTIVVTARVDSPDAQVNTATVSANQYDTVPANNSASAAISAATADLVVSKVVDDTAPANLGDTVTYTVQVTNHGPDAAKNVQVADALPAGTTLVSATAASGTTYSGGVWDIGAIPDGETRELTITATVDTLSPVTNTATATAGTVDPVPSDNTASAVVDVPDTDVRVTKTVNAPTPPVGTNVTFTITATNAGPLAATGVSVADVLPSNLTLVSASATKGTYTAGEWTIGGMANGAIETLTVVATVTNGTPLTNTATITADQEDGALANNTASADVDGQVAGIELTKTVDNSAPARVGDQVTYTITLKNNGPDAATNAAVSDKLPTGLSYVSSSASAGSYDAATGKWTIGTLANGVTETLTITATVDVTTKITNTATATSDLTDPTANVSSAVVDIPEADLALTKTVSDTTPAANGVVTYTLTVTNNGPDAATGVAVAEALPAGLTLVASRPSGSTSYTDPTWTIGTLASGASATLEIDARVTQSNAITNTATVASDVLDPTSANNDASATVNVPDADLSVTKTVDRTAPSIGGTVTYTVTVANAGPDTAPAVTVDDALPAGLTLVSASATRGTYSDPTWTVGSLANGAQATLTITARVTDSSAITNTATVSSDAADPTSANDSDAVTIDGPDADLSVTKTVDDATPPLNGDVTFTVTVANAGPDTARNVVVTDTLPSGLTLVGTPTATSGTYSAATGKWTISAVPSGTSETLTMTARVGDPSSLTNTARATSDAADPDTANNTGSASVDVPDADIAVTKTVDNATPDLGDTVIFTITATNNGPLGARGVVVTDAIPAGLTVAPGGITTTRGTVSGDKWTLGSMANGATETMTVTATVDEATKITNTATVASTSLDGDTTNDSASASVNVPDADLDITKTVDNTAPALGDTVTYTLTVTNNGPDAAQSVVIHDSLPAGLTYVSSTPAMDPTPGEWTVGTLANGATAVVRIRATVDDTTQITNTATVTSATRDLTPSNGSAVANVDVPEANLSLDKSASTATPRVGENVTYTITLTNAGPDSASNVDVAENLPAELDLVSATASRGTFTADTWHLATVPVGSHTLTIVARPNTEGAVVNTAEVVASDTRDPNSTPGDGTGDDTAQADIAVRPPLADLSLSKSVSTATPRVGDIVTYNLRVSNSGPSRATGVAVSDRIPAGYESATASQGSYDAATGLWNVGTVASGSSATIAIRVKITVTGQLVNTAEIAASNVSDPDSTPGDGDATQDDIASATLTASPAVIPTRLSISKTGPKVVRSGDVFSFIITIGNTGTSTATGVTITDCIPYGVSLVPSGSYIVRNGRLIWKIGNLAPGGTRSVRVKFKVDPTSRRAIRGCVASVVGANAPVAKDGAWVRIIPKKRVQRSAVTG